MMFRNFLKIAFRNLIRHKAFTLINISGLAIGLASFILIVLYVVDELSYDRFHEHAADLYRVGLDARLGSEEYIGSNTPGPLVPALTESCPEVLAGSRFDSDGEKLVTYFPPEEQNKPVRFIEEHFMYADSGFFSLFSFPLLKGDPATVLNRPRTLVLTEGTAVKYFGEEDPIGKTLRINDKDDYEVTGVCADIPSNSHIEFDLLASYCTIDSGMRTNWGSNSMSSYILLYPGTPPDSIIPRLDRLIADHFGPIIRDVMGVSLDEFSRGGNRYRFFLENIRDLHLRSITQSDSSSQSSILSVYLLSLIAFLILLIACINFMNLSTARSLTRSREVGMRKVLGSFRAQLIVQFLAESVLMSLLALVLAGILVELVLPAFNLLAGKQLEFSIWRQPESIPLLLLLGLFVGLISGAYSSVFLSSFRVMNVLKGKPRSGEKSKRFRSALVIFQFGISVFLIISTLTILSQIRYIRHKDLGYNRENLLIIEQTAALGGQYRSFMDEIRRIARVEGATASVTVPGQGLDQNGIMVEGAPGNEIHILARLPADEHFLEVYQIKLTDGRYFDPRIAGDSLALVINRNTIQSFDIREPVLGSHLLEPTGQEEQPVVRTVIGIVENINFQSIHNQVRPMGFEFLGNRLPNYISVRLQPYDRIRTIKKIEDSWNRFVPGQPFKYSFMDQELEQLYRAEEKLGTVFLAFSILAIFIACIGLLGLASFTADRRTKEIGVRKVLGSNSLQIIFLLTRDFSRWVIWANFLAWPFAFYFVSNWLNHFAYRAPVRPVFFLAAAFLSILVAWGTVLFHAARSAWRNPVDSLRYE